MSVNNSPARRAERRARAQQRACRPVIDCRVCGRRHARTRDCWGPVKPVDVRSWNFRKVLRGLVRKASGWAYRMVGR